jgi:hypothetical protein
LCHSPLDLEQREGRIQRFGGLSIRAALASKLKQQVLAKPGNGQSPWSVLAEIAEQAYSKDSSGLEPWWVCEDESVDRMVIQMPNSRQEQRYENLRRQRWLYRLALGQPQQQDFIEGVSRYQGREAYALNLSAWKDEMALIRSGKTAGPILDERAVPAAEPTLQQRGVPAA